MEKEFMVNSSLTTVMQKNNNNNMQLDPSLVIGQLRHCQHVYITYFYVGSNPITHMTTLVLYKRQ